MSDRRARHVAKVCQLGSELGTPKTGHIPSALFNIAMEKNPFIDDKHDELRVKMVISQMIFHSNVK